MKLRQTSLSDASVGYLIARCPKLKHLDVSFTLIRHPPPALSQIPALQKLSLTSTAVAAVDVVKILTLLPQLRTLALGALGANRGSRTSIGNSSAMTMTDEVLYSITDVLEHLQDLESVSLVGNTKLGATSKVNRALWSFVRRVGRRCKVCTTPFSITSLGS